MRRKSQPNSSTRENELADGQGQPPRKLAPGERNSASLSDEEIDAEIAIVRTQRLARKRASTAQKLTANS
jgi:hypothetical protein